MAAYDPSYDLASVAAMTGDLEQYLLSKELYWPLTAPSPSPQALPRLTLGGLRLALARLWAVQSRLTPEQLSVLQSAQSQLEAIRSKWAAAMDRKMAQELKSRLDLWQAFLQDCGDREARGRCAESYPQEARLRAMIALLWEATSPMAQDASLRERVSRSDALLRGIFVPGPFIWPPELQPSFPQDRFWFLYGKPRP